ncbi:MAG: hypothetical protein ACYTDT_01345 [Planctomycetota bacterium]|jgi:hypothetical protein
MNRQTLMLILLLLSPVLSATDLLQTPLGKFRRGGQGTSKTIPANDTSAVFMGFGAGVNNTRDNDSMFHFNAEFGINGGAPWLRSIARWSISYADDLNLQPEDFGQQRTLEVIAMTLDAGLMPRIDLPLVGLYGILGPSITWANRINSAGHAWGLGMFSVLGIDVGPANIRGYMELSARWKSIFAGDDRALERAVEFLPWDIKFGVRLFY